MSFLFQTGKKCHQNLASQIYVTVVLLLVKHSNILNRDLLFIIDNFNIFFKLRSHVTLLKTFNLEPKTDTSGDKYPLLKNVIYKDKLGNLQVNALTNGLISYR